jgi:hypothetical protein
MRNRPADSPDSLSLLDQHIFDQNRRLIEMNAALQQFLDSVPVAIEDAKKIIRATSEALPEKADLEMKRASETAINSLSTEVGRIAQTIAGDAASVARSDAMSRAFKWATGGVTVCAIFFTGLGWGLSSWKDNINLETAYINLETAKSEVVASYAREAAAIATAEKKSDMAIAAVEKKSHDEIEEMRKNSGWLGTAEGRLAKKFFDLGTGTMAAKCDSPAWEIYPDADDDKVKWCIPKKRNLIFEEDQKFGWKIP